jgi:antitoxin component YwqK of YwqJK toxin-antitoxin module
LKSEANYKDGKKDGLHRGWYENGQLMFEFNYKNGKRTLYKEWYENGRLESKKVYDNGNLIEEKNY